MISKYLLFICVGSFAAPAAHFDVRELGAKGDGLAKDTASLQAAIDRGQRRRAHLGVVENEKIISLAMAAQ